MHLCYWTDASWVDASQRETSDLREQIETLRRAKPCLMIRSICTLLITSTCLIPTLLAAEDALKKASNVWTVDSGSIDPKHYFGETVANGMIGILSAPAPFRVAQILLNEAYEPMESGGVDGIMRTLNFLDLSLSIDGVKVDRIDQTTRFHQTLDMKRAVFTTDFDFEDKATITTSLRALRQLPYTAMLEVRVSARRPITISIKSGISSEFPHDPNATEDEHFALDSFKTYSHDILLSDTPNQKIVVAAATASGLAHRVTLAAAQTFAFSASDGALPALRQEGSGLSFTRKLESGGDLHCALIGATASSPASADPVNKAQRLAATAYVEGIQRLINQHEKAWSDLWKSDILVEGDDTTQRDVHGMLYHLYSSIREGSDRSISPMGLSRDLTGYLGHIFWDAETWMFPSLLALHPELARSLLEYRFERLSAARQNAFSNGYRGAQFPWESAESGEEDIPLCCMPLEIHVTADIGIAAWDYYRVTQDREWLRTRGYPLLRATADFWTSRVERGAQSDTYSLEHVVAVDEYASDVSNDAFTNAAARENLAAAIAAARVLGVPADPEWALVRERIPILRFQNGVTREYANYEGATIKQADVNLLAYPLHEITSTMAIRRDLDYYASRVDQENGPAMTRSVFSVLYERLGMPQKAFDLFKTGYEPYQRPPFGVISETATSSNPYFVTGAGGLLQSMLFGFGGLEITDQGLVQRHTQLPSVWKSLTLTGIGVQRKEYKVQ